MRQLVSAKVQSNLLIGTISRPHGFGVAMGLSELPMELVYSIRTNSVKQTDLNSLVTINKIFYSM